MSATVTVDRSMPARIRSASLRRPRLRQLAGMAFLILAALVWTQLGTTALGGRSSYVVTDGVSMLPHFKANGLVITRTESNYRVGEVVAYHNRQLGTVVMHRLIAIDGGKYIFKGDNNNFVDSYQATRADLVGKEWIYLPGAGAYLNKLRQPAAFGVLLAVITLLSLWSFTPQTGRRRRVHHRT